MVIVNVEIVFLLKAVSKRLQTRTCSLYVERERVRRSQRQGFSL